MGTSCHGDHDSGIMCPSFRCESGAILLGMVQADGKIALATEPLVVDQDFVDRARQGGEQYQKFRFSGKCVMGRCEQWTGSRCGVIDRQFVELGERAAPAELPPCTIRSHCRWFKQSGASACAICPEVMSIPPLMADEPKEFLTLGMDRLQAAPENPVHQAEAAAADRYFAAVAQQDWDALLALYAPEFLLTVTPHVMRSMLVKFAEILGPYQSNQFQGRQEHSHANKGKPWETSLSYHVHFERGDTSEKLTLRRRSEGEPLEIVGHQIDSPALLAALPGVSRRA